jgi:hypothetical protein
MRSHLLHTAWVVLTIAATAALLQANEEEKDGEKDSGNAIEARRNAVVQAMQTVAKGIKVVRLSSAGESDCQMIDGSVLNWSDSARHPDLIVPGTMWIWHQKDRPAFVGEIYGRKDLPGEWFVFTCSLSADPLRVSDRRTSRMLTKSYYEPKEIANAPLVAKSKSERTFQMRQLVSRFEAHQFWEDRFELRLLPKPVHRYEHLDSGILDGALYALVHGTNPEVLLLIEAHATTDGIARWKVGFGSLAGAHSIVLLDGKELWSSPKHIGDPADPRQSFSEFVSIPNLQTQIEDPRKSQ